MQNDSVLERLRLFHWDGGVVGVPDVGAQLIPLFARDLFGDKAEGVAEIFDARMSGRFACRERMQAREMRAVPPEIRHRLGHQMSGFGFESRCALEKAEAGAAARADVERHETWRRGVANQNRRYERAASQSLRDQAREVGVQGAHRRQFVVAEGVGLRANADALRPEEVAAVQAAQRGEVEIDDG